MCTAVTYQTADFYVGRTLDHTTTYGEDDPASHGNAEAY